MKPFVTKVFWFLNGVVFIPAVVALYVLLLRPFGLLGIVPAAYFGSAVMISIMVCRKSRLFLAGLLASIALIVMLGFLAERPA